VFGKTAGRQAVELVYQSTNGRRVTVYLRHSAGAPYFDQFGKNDVRVCIWQDDVLGTVVAGNVSTAEMQRIAGLTYQALPV
jgi:anti-sigma factor RsiW